MEQLIFVTAGVVADQAFMTTNADYQGSRANRCDVTRPGTARHSGRTGIPNGRTVHKGLAVLKFCESIADHQMRTGRYFALENPFFASFGLSKKPKECFQTRGFPAYEVCNLQAFSQRILPCLASHIHA